MKKPALGKGLGALLGTVDTGTATGERVSHVELSLIVPNRFQPRRSFDKERLQELAESIKASGVIQPLVVRRAGGSYELVSGERRLQAARIAGLGQVPVILRDVDERQLLVVALVENLQREDLNPIDEAMALTRLVEEFGLSHQDLGAAIGKSRVHITNMLRILKLPDKVKEFMAEGRLSFGHAKILAGMKDSEAAMELARRIVTEGLSVRQVERLAGAPAPNGDVPRGTSSEALPPHLQQVERNLAEILGLPVKIHKGKRQGRLEIQFRTADEFEALVSRVLRMENRA